MAIELPTEIEPARSPEPPDADTRCTAESAECTCPDFCERDHDTD
jgi:hypothetical protein